MEINVTHLVDEDCSQFSDSIANSGLQNIGEITWRNACEYAELHSLVSKEQQNELREWIQDFGAWDEQEISNMSNIETNALLLQFVAGDIREMESFESYEEYQKAAENGSCSGNLYRGDDESWYFYVGC